MLVCGTLFEDEKKYDEMVGIFRSRCDYTMVRRSMTIRKRC